VIGERLQFSGNWYGIPVGYGSVEVLGRTTIREREAIHIRLEGRSNAFLSRFYPIHDEIDTFVDAETFLPLESRKHQREGRYHAQETVQFHHGRRIAFYRSHLNDSVKEIPLPESFQEILSALYWFRRQPLDPDKPLFVNMYTDEKVYETEIEVSPPKPLELLKRGTFDCFIVRPKARFKGLLVRRGSIWAYFTADKRRLPLMIRASTPWGVMSAVLDEASILQQAEP